MSTSHIYDVLLVDPNEAERRLFRTACLPLGVSRHLHELADGQEALDFLFQRHTYMNAPAPDLIVLGLNLPKVSGHEVLRQVKSHETLKAIPVIVLSMSSTSVDVRKCYDLGACAFVRKPEESERFREVAGRLQQFWLRTAVLPFKSANARRMASGCG